MDGTDTDTQAPGIIRPTDNNFSLHTSADGPSISPGLLGGGATPSPANDSEAVTAEYLRMGGATTSAANDNEAIAAEYLRVIGDRLQASDTL